MLLFKHGCQMTDKVSETPKKAEEPTDELPEVDEATIGELSEEVCQTIFFLTLLLTS